MRQERRAYEWSILWYSMDKDGHYENSDPEFADDLRTYFASLVKRFRSQKKKDSLR